MHNMSDSAGEGAKMMILKSGCILDSRPAYNPQDVLMGGFNPGYAVIGLGIGLLVTTRCGHLCEAPKFAECCECYGRNGAEWVNYCRLCPIRMDRHRGR